MQGACNIFPRQNAPERRISLLLVNHDGPCYIVMKQLAIALGLLGTALGANAALVLRPETVDGPPVGTARIELSGRIVEIPRALIRDRTHFGGGRLDRVDLAVAMSDFTPLPAPAAKDPNRPLPDALRIILSANRDQADSAEMFQSVHARFLGAETWSNPGGLIMRRFRSGTPYEDRELYLGVGSGRPFVALCPKDETMRTIEPCSTVIRQDGLDIELRFAARHLPEWRRFMPQALAMVAEFAAAGRRIPLP